MWNIVILLLMMLMFVGVVLFAINIGVQSDHEKTIASPKSLG